MKILQVMQLLAILSFKKCLNNNSRKIQILAEVNDNLCPQTEAENTQKRINAQQYPAFIWNLSLRM